MTPEEKNQMLFIAGMLAALDDFKWNELTQKEKSVYLLIGRYVSVTANKLADS